MKVAYLGKIQLSDVDLSYLHEAQQLADITFVVEISPRFMKGPAFNIKSVYPKSGVFKATEVYPEFQKYSPFIDTDKFYVVNTSGRLWLLKSFWTHIKLLRFLRKGKFDAIHLAWQPNIYEFILYFLRQKMLLTVHDPLPHSGYSSLIVSLRRKAAFRLVPRLIILNKAQRQDFIDTYHIKPERIIDSQLSCYTYLRMVQPATTGIGQQGSYILFAGRITPYKGLEYLLPAMKKVHEQCPDCRLVVAGSGAFHFDIEAYKQLDYIDIRNRFIPDDELVALIQRSAFLVCPYNDATQSGVIMSAYAFNKPVVATRVGGLPEMVKDHRYGVIVKEKDEDALAEAIVNLWKQPELCSTFAANIKEAYETGENSWKHIAEKLCAEYA